MPISLTTPDARDRLDVRDRPYFVRISDTLHIGYKKGKSINRWIVRWRVASGYVSRTLRGVVPDDAMAANGGTVLSYHQALRRILDMNRKNLDADVRKRCAFCGRSQFDVDILVAGSGSHICDACIRRSSAILDAGRATQQTSESSPGTVEVLLNPGFEFRLPAAAMCQLIDRTLFAAATDDKRIYLNGLLLEIAQNSVRAVATNAHYLAVAEVPLDLGLTEMQHMIIARDGVTDLRRTIAGDEGDLRLTVENNRLRVVHASGVTTADLLFGRFPNYRDVVPAHPGATRCSVSALVDAVASVQPGAGEPVRIGVGSEVVEVTAGDARRAVPASGTDMPAHATFNRTYLANVLSAIDTEEVVLSCAPGSASWRLEPARPDGAYESTYVIMRIKDERDSEAA